MKLEWFLRMCRLDCGWRDCGRCGSPSSRVIWRPVLPLTWPVLFWLYRLLSLEISRKFCMDWDWYILPAVVADFGILPAPTPDTENFWYFDR